jgi:hypothetical protein
LVDGNTINTGFVRNETLVRYCPALAIRRLHFGSFECLKCYYDTVIFLCLFAVHDCSSRIGVAGNGQPTRPAPISVRDFLGHVRPCASKIRNGTETNRPLVGTPHPPLCARPAPRMPSPTPTPSHPRSRVVGTWRCSSPSLASASAAPS